MSGGRMTASTKNQQAELSIYLKELVLKNLEISGSLFAHTQINRLWLEHTDVRGPAFYKANLEALARLSSSIFKGEQSFAYAKALGELTFDRCVFTNDNTESLRGLTVEGTLKLNQAIVHQTLDLREAQLDQKLMLNDWSVYLSPNEEGSESLTRPLYQLDLSGLECAGSLHISSPIIIGEDQQKRK
jgi:hypothetical protein